MTPHPLHIVPILGARGILTVAQASVIQRFQPAQHGSLVVAVATFVSGQTENNAALVSVAQNGALHPLQKLCLPLQSGTRPVTGVRVEYVRRLWKARDRAVRFDVRFQHDIEAQLVAQLQKHW